MGSDLDRDQSELRPSPAPARPLRIDPTDAAPGDGPERLAAALSAYRCRVAATWEDFDRAYRFLLPEFGPRNEIEREDVLAAWFRDGRREVEGQIIAYDLLLVESLDGELVAVRDCYSAIFVAEALVVVLLSHALVAPAHRRTGVASILRAVPTSWAEAHAEAAGLSDPDVVLVAEMEPLFALQHASIVRHLAYARAGFRVLRPALLPYAQVDFRDTEALGVEPTPVPMMWVMRRLGPAARRDPAALPVATARHVLDAIHTFHRPAVEPRQIPMLSTHILAPVPSEGVLPLVALDPRVVEPWLDLLAVHARPLYPQPWWPVVRWPDVEDEHRALRAFLGALT